MTTPPDDEWPDTHLDPEALLRVLQDHDVRYVLVGGYAMVVYAVPDRLTMDIDIVPDRRTDNLENLATALRALNARVVHYADAHEIHAQRRPLTPELFEANPFLHLYTARGRVDVLLAPTGLPEGYDGLIGRARVLDVDGLRITVADIRDLITTKEATGRPRDLVDVRVLRERLGADRGGRLGRVAEALDRSGTALEEPSGHRERGVSPASGDVAQRPDPGLSL
ncbi:nucleotidyl transferase AbiEii/AbiGii toxin family protein [Embleya sp. NPDC127516]|uniref:nucleotidyl transferase AbiEii/AbiGii toxin family protein n=1 Tax=Embleya sp. NPDC127516 TaxID=3363990 RepID=UPI003824D15D